MDCSLLVQVTTQTRLTTRNINGWCINQATHSHQHDPFSCCDNRWFRPYT